MMKRDPVDELMKLGKVKGTCYSIKDSGHHLYAQQPAQCNYVIIDCAYGN
jgi:hypothetical protein